MLDKIEHDAEILELRMDRPPVNALDPELVKALNDAVLAAPSQGKRAIVLSGREGMFSAGLDVQALIDLERPAMEAFYASFHQLWEALAFSQIPVAAAITGHAPAGGAALSIFCDYSIMAEGNYRIGLNEVAVGLTVPSPICGALARRVGPHMAERMLTEARMPDPKTAAKLGMVDECMPVGQVVDRALAWCRTVADMPRQAYTQTRDLARDDLRDALRNPDTTPERFADMWFSDEAQGTVRNLIARLKKKRAS